jgi:solute carrier family 35 protein F1/2
METSRSAVIASEPELDKFDKEVDIPENAAPELHAEDAPSTQRPPLDYSSAGAFVSSVGRRFKSIWTRRFALSLLAGQVVSLCITCTNVTTTELVSGNWSLPTTQTFFL